MKRILLSFAALFSAALAFAQVTGSTISYSVSGPAGLNSGKSGDLEVCSDAAGTNCAGTITVQTDSNGNATVYPKSGIVAGVYTITVAASGVSSVTTTYTVLPGPLASLALVSGASQAVQVKGVGVPLVVAGADQYGNIE